MGWTPREGPCQVQVRGLEVSFYTGRRRIDVLQSIDLSVAPGERIALIGPSGSGKSTFLYSLAGLVRPQAGSVEVDGLDLSTCTEGMLAAFRLWRVGIVYQSFHLFSGLSALDNVALPLRLAGRSKSAARARAQRLLDAVGLAHRASHRPAQLSGGEQQRVAVARAMANEPGLVLADEPTGSLDQEVGVSVLNLLLDQSRGRTVVLATHQPDVAARLDRVVAIRGGRLVSGSDAVG